MPYISETDPRKIIGVNEFNCEQRRNTCQEKITNRLDRITVMLVDMSNAVSTHVAEHQGADKARAEITGEHERARTRVGAIVGWVAAALGFLGSLIAGVWYLAKTI